MSGFTLIEVLLATAIFAVISLASFSVLDGVIKTKDGVESKQAQLNEIQRAWLIIERDLLQIAWRSMRVEGESPSTNYLYASQDSYDDSDQWLSFVRAGWSNPNLVLPRSDLQAVAYRIKEENFQRLHFNFVDAVVGEEPKIRELIKGVEQMQVQYYVDNKWQEQLPTGAWPAAIDFKLTIKGVGEVNRKFIIAEKPSPITQKQNERSNDGNDQPENREQQNTNTGEALP
ncbi:type II secretion system protein J [Thalassotalea marina]|uniref:Type II secretion system protein J n=2 Tax=Thalassotalea marina TaxID=1673741 RepID=A0A919EPG7_9GAMM|nr:type II secretion system protein J [Thalassotalea marina]